MLQGARAKTDLSSHRLSDRQRRDAGTRRESLVGFSPACPGRLQLPVPLDRPWPPQPGLKAGLLPAGSQPFRCLYCSASFRFPGALQSHVTSEHFKQTESTFTCELCGELFPSQGELEGHYSAEHPKVVLSQATTAQIVQVKTALRCSPCGCSSILPLQPPYASQIHPAVSVTPSAP